LRYLLWGLSVAAGAACTVDGYVLDVGADPARAGAPGTGEPATSSVADATGANRGEGGPTAGDAGTGRGGSDEGNESDEDAGADGLDGSLASDVQGVTIVFQPSAPAICAGQCVTLEAQVYGAEPPYQYAWANLATLASVAADGGVVRVCPTSTTRYLVVATAMDTAVVQYPTATQGQVTVTVVDCDGGASLADAGAAPSSP
jgi:hypothetical protein